ncbi:NAD-dependent epimerase/dehydratase family protein [Candidatus Woesearchaeota archaeon]|nr:NAD-dependent epimerase/dehydratase family protein [Candidatus Woesearchaeota archaeon]
MEIMVTGGSGFIGHILARHLLDEGNKVKVIDVNPIKFTHPNLEFVRKSILDNITKDIKGCDAVFHFAALLGVANSDKRPLDTMKINLEGSVNVFKSAIDAGVRRMIYSSSSEVYGEPRELPIKEESVKGPVSTYGVSKLAAEIYAKAYSQEFGADIRVVRFFNVYGIGQEPNWVVPIFIGKALRNEQIEVFGNGTQTRCFTYVEDIADGVLKVFEKGKQGEAYNIGNNNPTTILELANLIKELAKSKSEIKKAGFGKETRLKEREIEYRIPDISKMKELGWRPRTMVKEGIKKILENMKKNH